MPRPAPNTPSAQARWASSARRPASPRTAAERGAARRPHAAAFPGRARTHPPGCGPEGPEPTAVLATSRGDAWRATGNRGDSHRGGRQPAHGNGRRAPNPSPAGWGGGDLSAQARLRAAILTPGGCCRRHLGVGRSTSGQSRRTCTGRRFGMGIFEIRAGLQQASQAISWPLAAHTAPACRVNTLRFQK